MKHTHEQLEEMSDAELNAIMHTLSGEHFVENVPDYCNEWSDIMLLTIDHGIAVKKVPLRKEWIAKSIDYSEIMFKCFDREDLQRAIACCLIMVLESKA
jgi:hypothetical protein